VLDDPGRIFPGLFDGPDFFDVVSASGVDEISLGVPGPIAESKLSIGGKTKGGVSGFGVYISAISNQVQLDYIYQRIPSTGLPAPTTSLSASRAGSISKVVGLVDC
jgi:hypothetical protein